MRIEFACGSRALRHFRLLRDTAHQAAGALSTPVGELPQSIDRLLADVKEQRRMVAALQSELARYRAEALVSAAEITAQGRLVAAAIDADAAGLKSLASAVTAHPGIVAALVSTSSPALIVIARSGDLTIRSNDVLTTLTASFGGRGGGKPDLAQGGGLKASAEVILAAAREAIVNA
jgi:alanyl-tRNA synthetase